METLGRLWRGELPPGQVFWNWVVFGGIVVNITTTAAFLVLLAWDHAWLALAAHYVPSLPYNLFVLVAAWRSANQHREAPVVAELVRWLSVAGIVILSIL